MFQVPSPAALKKKVLTQIHQEHCHQGVERKLDLLQQWHNWLGMFSEVAYWCQICERCKVAKDTHIAACSYMGYLLVSWPNEILAIDYTILDQGIECRMEWNMSS